MPSGLHHLLLGLGLSLAMAPASPLEDVRQSGLRLDERAPYFEHRSETLVGDKGERALDVSVPSGPCGTIDWVFDHAELRVRDARFADAQMVQIPEAGCTACKPLVVRWFHEPTGRLHFHVNVYRRPSPVVCANDDGLPPNHPSLVENDE